MEGFLEIAVLSSDPNRVVYIKGVSPQPPFPMLYTFADWSTETPPEAMFKVPSACSQSQGGADQQVRTTTSHGPFLTQTITKMMSLFKSV